MPIRFQKWITRQDLKNNPNVYYVFGDNEKRCGLGGQAKEMRGEPNAIGVCTKKAPGMNENDFYNEGTGIEYPDMAIGDMDKIIDLVLEGKTVVMPSDGLGTGLSQLPYRHPSLYSHLYFMLQYMYKEGTIPWEKPHGFIEGTRG